MRLDAIEKAALSKALEKVSGEIYLFGSRVDDGQKGGDIDILILSKENAYRLSQKVATRFFVHCEETVDVVVMNPQKLTKEQRAFINTLRLERWQ